MNIHDGKLTLVKVTDSVRKANTDISKRIDTIGSLTPFVSAAGDVLLKVYCLKATASNVKLCVPYNEEGTPLAQGRKVISLSLSTLL